MNFLALDTSGKYLSVIAYREGKAEIRFLPDCALRHSVVLMDEIDKALSALGMRPRDCDFFAAVVGPGSFTGVRIGISTVKGLCFSVFKPALSITSFECAAYAEENSLIALLDAGRGEVYACAFGKEKNILMPPCILPADKIPEGFKRVSLQPLEGCKTVDPAAGLLKAVLAKADCTIDPENLKALYLRKSSAEENRR